LLFPDQCTMYLAAIEDADYKEEKIGCELPDDLLQKTSGTVTDDLRMNNSLERCLRFRLQPYASYRTERAFGRLCRIEERCYQALSHQGKLQSASSHTPLDA